jgi:hypothetical protein
MMDFVCSKCLFAEDTGSSDLIYCFIKKEFRKINDQGCAKFKDPKAIEEDQGRFF